MKKLLLPLVLWAFTTQAQQFTNYRAFEGFTGVELSLHYPDTAITTVTVSGVTLSDTCASCGFNFSFLLPPWSNWTAVVTRNSITTSRTYRVHDMQGEP
jgi:hypothetical protein